MLYVLQHITPCWSIALFCQSGFFLLSFYDGTFSPNCNWHFCYVTRFPCEPPHIHHTSISKLHFIDLCKLSFRRTFVKRIRGKVNASSWLWAAPPIKHAQPYSSDGLVVLFVYSQRVCRIALNNGSNWIVKRNEMKRDARTPSMAQIYSECDERRGGWWQSALKQISTTKFPNATTAGVAYNIYVLIDLNR